MTPMSVRTIGLRTHSRPRYVTPSRPSLKGSTPETETVPTGDMRLPERRRRRVVLPAPLAEKVVSVGFRALHRNGHKYLQSRALYSQQEDLETHP